MKHIFVRAAAVLAIGISTAHAIPVRDVRIAREGYGPVDESFVRAQISVRAGQELDRAAVARDVRTLLDTGRFADVGAVADVGEDGVTVVYSVRNRLRLSGPPAVQGAEALTENEVRDQMGLRRGDLVDDALVAARAQRVVDRYRELRYPDARVACELRVVDEALGLAEATVRIREGARAHIAEMRFTGNEAVSDAELRSAMRMRAPWNPLRWFLKKRYDPLDVREGAENIRSLYLARGYLDAQVGEPRLSETAPGRLVVTVPVEEGRLYRVGAVTIEGVTLFPEAEIRRLIALAPGDTAAMTRLRGAAQAVRDFYGTRGYLGANADPQLQPGDPGVVSVRFRVREGELTTVRNVLIRGNSRTQDKVIRRELLVQPGDRYDSRSVQRSERRLQNLGFFSQVNSYPEPAVAPGQSDLVFQVEEQRTGQFVVGAGFSSVDDLVGYAEVSQGNFDLFGWPSFTGAGQKLKLRARVGTELDEYELSFVEPWFLDRRLSLGIDAYTRSRVYSEYDVRRTGGSVSLGFPMPGPHRMDLGYRLEQIDITGVADTAPYTDTDGSTFAYDEEGARTVSSFSAIFTRDLRDNVFVPTRGHKVRFSGYASGGLFGFDTDIYGLELTAEQHVSPWFNHVVSVRGRAEIVEAYGNTDDVPLSDRLYAGGARTIRGFQYREVGPKAYRDETAADGSTIRQYRPRGGQTLVAGTVEYTVPIVSNIRLAGFCDAGALAVDAYDFALESPAVGAGFGIRLDIPGFPIRIDYAWDVQTDDDVTQLDPWSFWIGYGF